MTKIAMLSGRCYDYAAPAPDQITLTDIVNGLRAEPRYGGHTVKPWSVLQHSLLVACMVSRESVLHALLHDAPEAYMRDLSSPAKQWLRQIAESNGRALSDYDLAEQAAWEAICGWAGILPHCPPEVHAADYGAMLIEAPELQPKQWHSEVWREHRETAQRVPPPRHAVNYFHSLLYQGPHMAVTLWQVWVCDELAQRKVAR